MTIALSDALPPDASEGVAALADELIGVLSTLHDDAAAVESEALAKRNQARATLNSNAVKDAAKSHPDLPSMLNVAGEKLDADDATSQPRLERLDSSIAAWTAGIAKLRKLAE